MERECSVVEDVAEDGAEAAEGDRGSPRISKTLTTLLGFRGITTTRVPPADVEEAGVAAVLLAFVAALVMRMLQLPLTCE